MRMKALLAAGVLLLLSALMSAQTANTGQKPPAATAPPVANTTAQTPAAPKGPKAPEAKTQEEYKEYNAAVAMADAVAAEAAADQFATKYPASELRALLYVKLMQMYYQDNKSDKVIEVGRKALVIDPENAMSKVLTATALAESTRDSDLDREEKYTEATKYAEGAIPNVNSLVNPPNLTPEQFESMKSVLRSMAYSARGYIEMNRKNYAGSEENFQKAIESNPAQPDPTLYLRLAIAQDNQKKYPLALASTNKAIEFADAQGSEAVSSLGKSERDRLNKLIGTAPKPAAKETPKQ